MTYEKPTFDMQALRESKDWNGKDGILTLLIKQLTKALLGLNIKGKKSC